MARVDGVEKEWRARRTRERALIVELQLFFPNLDECPIVHHSGGEMVPLLIGPYVEKPTANHRAILRIPLDNFLLGPLGLAAGRDDATDHGEADEEGEMA